MVLQLQCLFNEHMFRLDMEHYQHEGVSPARPPPTRTYLPVAPGGPW